MKKILIIEGNPKPQSFSLALAKAYQRGAIEAGANPEFVRLSELKFEFNLVTQDRNAQVLEPDLIDLQSKIRNAEHLVFVYPVWWSMMPALMKAMLDRVFLPGFAFEFEADGTRWKKLLEGRSAHVILTLGTPYLPYVTMFGKAAHKAMVDGVLKFCGISPVRVSSIYQVLDLSDEERQDWLKDIYEEGRQLL